ncbi:MAG: hypothetical protein IKD23_02570 [Lentisphaeria bacterium]|nr:hypothetical protein [Lentisphaeria bacterium]
MKKFFFPAALLLFAGCSSTVVNIGSSFAPLAKDGRGINYIKSDGCREIRYKKFAFNWDEKAGFRVYQPENSPEKAVWRSMLPVTENHSAMGTVYRRAYSLADTSQDGLLNFAEKAFSEVPRTRIKIMEQKFEKIAFAGQPAIRVYCVSKETGREIFMIQTTIVFPCPEDPENFLYFVAWSQRGREKDYRDEELVRQGELFLGSFKLL